MQVTCMHHRDPEDPAGTKCKKTLQFNDDTKDNVVRKLKEWCLAGRWRYSRRLLADGGGHLKIPIVAEPRSHAVLDAALEAALASDDWILVHPEG